MRLAERRQLRLNGRVAQDVPPSVTNVEFYEPVFAHTSGSTLVAHVVIVGYRQDTTTCPSGRFAFFLVKPDGTGEATDAFGTCEKPEFKTVDSDWLFAKLPRWQPGMLGTETWTLHGGRLSASAADLRPAPNASLPAVAIDPNEGHTAVTLEGSVQVTSEGWYEFALARKMRISAPGSVCDGQEVDRFPYTRSATDADASLIGEAGMFNVQLFCWDKYAYVGVDSITRAGGHAWRTASAIAGMRHVRRPATSHTLQEHSMGTSYRVLLNGIQADQQPNDVVRRVASLFKLSPQEALTLLMRRGVCVKRGLDQRGAEKYRAVLAQLGCESLIEQEPNETEPANGATQATTPPIAAGPGKDRGSGDAWHSSPGEQALGSERAG